MKNFKMQLSLLFFLFMLTGNVFAQSFTYEYGNSNSNERADGLIQLNNNELLLYGTSVDNGGSFILNFLDQEGILLRTRTFPTTDQLASLKIDKMLIDNNNLIYGAGFGRNTNSRYSGILFCYDLTNDDLVWYREVRNYRFHDLDFYTDTTLTTNLLASGKEHNAANTIENTHLGIYNISDGSLFQSYENYSYRDKEADHFNSSIILPGQNVISTGRLNLGNAAHTMRLNITSTDLINGNVNYNNTYITPLPNSPTSNNIEGRTYGLDLIIDNNNLITYGSGSATSDILTNSNLFLLETDLMGVNLTSTSFTATSYTNIGAGAIKFIGNNLLLSGSLLDGTNRHGLLFEYDITNDIIVQSYITSLAGFNSEQINQNDDNHLQVYNGNIYLTATGTNSQSDQQMILYRIPANNYLENCELAAITMTQSIGPDTISGVTFTPNNSLPNPLDRDTLVSIDTIDMFNFCCPDTLLVIDSLKNINCFGDSLGSIFVSAINGQAPYTFELYLNTINNLIASDTSGSFDSLYAGDYFLFVEDALGCKDSLSFVIVEPDSILISGVVTHESCALLDGMISATISGGSPPYSSYWTGPNGFTSLANPITNLAPGAYRFFVEDSLVCESVAPFLILPGNDPNYGVSLNDSIYCIGDLWCLNITGDDGDMTMVINGQTTSFTNIPLPFEFNPFCDSIFLEDLPDFNIGENEICVYFESDSGNCTDTICVDFFIDECCDYNPFINVSDSLVCGSQEFEYQYGPSSWHQLNFTFDNNVEIGDIVKSDTTFGFDPITGLITGIGNLSGLPSGEVIVTIIMFEDDTLGCSDTIEQLFFIEECCDYNPTFSISSDTLCEFEEFEFSFGPSEWHEFIYSFDGLSFSSGIIRSDTEPGYDVNTGIISGIESFSDMPSDNIELTIIMYEEDTLGCLDSFSFNLFIPECDSLPPYPCEEYEGLAAFEYVINNDGTVSFTDISSSNGPTPDYVIWVFPNESINASPNETIDYEFDYSDSITVCMIAAWFHDENSDDCCFDTICQPIYINNLCWDLGIEMDVTMDIDPFDPLHYYFENNSTPAPASNYMWSIDGASFETSYDHTFDYYFTTEGSHTIIARTIWHLAEDSNLCCIEDLVINIIISDSIDCDKVDENIALDVNPMQVSSLTTRQFTLNIPNGLIMNVNSIDWNFDDINSVNPQTSNLDYTLQHSFINDGVHNVCADITFTTINGIECLVQKCIMIEVLPFSLTPNPASKNLYINYESATIGEEYQYEIYDINGKMVLEELFNSSSRGQNKEKVSINFLSHGTYYLSFYNQGNLVGTENFIKE